MTASQSDHRHGDPAELRRLASDRTGPTVLRIVLGAQLRALREASGITLERAGYEIRASHSKMSRIELGRVSFKDRDVADLLTLYGVTDGEERETLCALARQANAQGWWHSYTDILPPWFESYVGLERAADRIRTYQVQFVPGLLQTEDYARGVVLLEHAGEPDAEITRRVNLRMERQEILSQPPAPSLWAVVDDAALRRPIGGPEVMRGQLRHLMDVAALPDVTLQVIPFGAGGHAAAGGPFSILRFPEPDLPDVVYLEQLTSALYLDKRDDTDHYLAVMERLCLEALPADETSAILEGILKEFS
jgi:transcriptional regulator with XRE-family HTH domain